jgi:hypothetical protein
MSEPTVNIAPESVPGVRWEPCSAFHDDPADGPGVCAGCGWPPDDHGAEVHLADAA